MLSERLCLVSPMSKIIPGLQDHKVWSITFPDDAPLCPTQCHSLLLQKTFITQQDVEASFFDSDLRHQNRHSSNSHIEGEQEGPLKCRKLYAFLPLPTHTCRFTGREKSYPLKAKDSNPTSHWTPLDPFLVF